MMTTIRQRHLRYVGLAKDCLIGKIKDTGAGGKQRMKLMDGVKAVVLCGNIGEVVCTAEDRSR